MTNTMKLKSRFGMGLKKKSSKKRARVVKGLKKKVSLKKIIKAGAFKSTPSNCALTVIRSALKKVRSAVNPLKTRQNLADISRNELCHTLHN